MKMSGVSALAISFSAPLIGDVATLTVTVLIFLEDGLITPTSTETFSVYPGSVKFNVEVGNLFVLF